MWLHAEATVSFKLSFFFPIVMGGQNNKTWLPMDILCVSLGRGKGREKGVHHARRRCEKGGVRPNGGELSEPLVD